MGNGHVQRCIALGLQWQARGGKVTFLSNCEGDELRERIRAAGFGLKLVVTPHPDGGDLQATLLALGELSDAQGVRPWLVVDGYHFDEGFLAAVRGAGYRILLIDDLARLEAYNADVILNQNINADRLQYNAPSETAQLLGLKYALLRREFLRWRNHKRSLPAVARRILITYGGSDPENATMKAIEALHLAQVDSLEAVVVVGGNNPCHEEIAAAVSSARIPIRLVRNATNMDELMAWADVAIAAAGSTCWELALMGLPSLLLELAENQRRSAEGLQRSGAAVNLGPAGAVTPSRIAQELTALCHDRKLREAMSTKARLLVDGRGADRVSDLILGLESRGLEEAQVTVRTVAHEDALAIWRLANDPGVRFNSFNPASIHLDQHLEWFRRTVNATDTRFWILEIGGAIAAQVRYTRTDPTTAEVHFAVAAPFRGKGLGTIALSLTSRQSCLALGVRRIQGVAFQQNSASCRVFLKAGFMKRSETQLQGRICCIFEQEWF